MYLHLFLFQCHHNETLYNLLDLKTVYDVEGLKNWRQTYGIEDFIASLRNRIRLDDDLRSIQILSPNARDDLARLAESQISDLNLTQYTKLMREQITNLELGTFCNFI